MRRPPEPWMVPWIFFVSIFGLLIAFLPEKHPADSFRVTGAALLPSGERVVYLDQTVHWLSFAVTYEPDTRPMVLRLPATSQAHVRVGDVHTLAQLAEMKGVATIGDGLRADDIVHSTAPHRGLEAGQ